MHRVPDWRTIAHTPLLHGSESREAVHSKGGYYMTKALLLVFITLFIGAGVQSETMKSSELSVLSRSKPHESLYTTEGIASYYADAFDGKTTSNGEVFDMDGLTAAHQSFPFNTIARVTDLLSGRSVKVRINDRGPFWENRIIDLSRGAAEKLGIVDRGIALVKIDVLKWGG
jgi:rare lipoprotein A (peptidoglycan hydrolase)